MTNDSRHAKTFDDICEKSVVRRCEQYSYGAADLPPAVARAFVKDMADYFIKADCRLTSDLKT